MSRKRNKNNKNAGAFITNPIVHPDKRDEKTRSAIPSEQNVEDAKDWVDFNHK